MSDDPAFASGATSISSKYVRMLDVRTYVHLLVILVLLLIDFVPRFYQGDSLQYVRSDLDRWLPPERSWSFGLAVNFLLRYTHGYSSFLIIQAIVLGCIAIAARRFFQKFPEWQLAYSLTAIALCADPLLESYTRFYMTDFPATAFFIVSLIGLQSALDPDANRSVAARGFCVFLFATIATIFLRIAYLPILELTLLGIALCRWSRRSAAGWTLAAAAVMPFLAVGILAGTNSIAFSKWFPGEVFVNKLSGIMLASTFAPALQMTDFEKAGIPITPEEFSNLDLGDYDRRLAHTWSASTEYLGYFLQKKLHVNNVDKQFDAAATRLVTNAFLRNPGSFVEVYAKTGWNYLKPNLWKNHIDEEMGIRPLPDEFVDYFNTFSVTKLVPSISELKSPLVLISEQAAPIYPALLGVGCLAGLFLLLREGGRPCVPIPCSALFADLLAAPLYSVYTIPRFLLAGIFVSYLLVGLAALSLLSSNVRIGSGGFFRPRGQS